MLESSVGVGSTAQSNDVLQSLTLVQSWATAHQFSRHHQRWHVGGHSHSQHGHQSPFAALQCPEWL